MTELYAILCALALIISLFIYRICHANYSLKTQNELLKTQNEAFATQIKDIKSNSPDLEMASEIMHDFKNKGYTFLRIDPDSVLLRK